MTPAGIEPATFLFVAQHLNHCATAVLASLLYVLEETDVIEFAQILFVLFIWFKI